MKGTVSLLDCNNEGKIGTDLSIIRTQFSDDDKRGVCILGQDFKRNALAGSIKCTGVFEKLLITIFLLFLLILLALTHSVLTALISPVKTFIDMVKIQILIFFLLFSPKTFSGLGFGAVFSHR